MLVQLPDFYEDELMYSVICRYYAHSGYMSYDDAIKAIFSETNAVPSIEFINRYTLEVYDILTENRMMKDIVLNNTMFNLYSWYLPKPNRKRLLFEMSAIKPNNFRFKFLRAKKPNRNLKYCPKCAENDRENFGEAYWHRSHQTDAVICSVHGCYLMTVSTGAKCSKLLIPADSVIPEEYTYRLSNNQREKEEAAKLDKMLNTIDL